LEVWQIFAGSSDRRGQRQHMFLWDMSAGKDHERVGGPGRRRVHWACERSRENLCLAAKSLLPKPTLVELRKAEGVLSEPNAAALNEPTNPPG
jgi:hypothetical protein